MAENKIKINQAFYGEVNRAHSCIKQTLSDPDLTSFLIAFTDRPAALPLGASLLPYLSGSPFLNYYILTKTFPDQTATRSGMVFTHVLIFNIEEVVRINNLQDVLSHFVDSTERKNDELVEIQVNISNARINISDKYQPKYIQETIRAFITGVSPILFSGDISTFSNALQQIWNSPNIASRKKMKFRTSFTLSDIESITDLTIVSIQKSFLPKWYGQKIIKGEDQEKVEIVAYSELLFLEHKADNPFYNFLVELNVDLSDAQWYSQYEKLYINYKSINEVEDANILRQEIRVLAKISPSPNEGRKIKQAFLDRLIFLIESKADSNIKALRNITWSAFPNWRRKINGTISVFIEDQMTEYDFNSELISELIILTINEPEKNWWHEELRNSFIFHTRGFLPAIGENIWKLLLFSEESLVCTIKLFENELLFDIGLTTPLLYRHEKIDLLTVKKVQAIAREKKWLILHAKLYLEYLTIEKATLKQLELETNLSLANSEGVKYLVRKLAPEELIDLALNTNDDKLVELSTKVIEKDILLLKRMDLTVLAWLKLWTAFVIKTKNVFIGMDGRENEIVYTVLDLVIKGIDVNEIVLKLIADSSFSDLSDYKNRGKVWGKIGMPLKQIYLEATTQSVFRNFLSGKIQAQSIESDISEKITSDLFMTNFLNKNNDDIESVIIVFSTFKNLKDNFLADYISYFRGNIPELQAKKLGQLVRNNNFSKSAKTIYEKAKHNSSFTPAYQVCSELVSLNWWESIWNSELQASKKSTIISIPMLSKEDSVRVKLPTIVILTAINEEYLAVRRHLKEVVEADQNDTNYEAGIFEYNGKEIAKIVIRECGAKNTTASQETERAIQYFRPSSMFFVGIAGSRKPNDFSIGDVIFPEKVYSYEGGKSERDSFVVRPDLATVTFTMMEVAKKERRKEDWKVLIKGGWEMDVKADLGVIASGEQVVEHYNSEIGRILTQYYNDTSAVEMEGFGFAKAASRQGRETNNIMIGIVRGISDIIEQSGKKKNPKNHDRRPLNSKLIATDTAAAFAFWLIFKTFGNQK